MYYLFPDTDIDECATNNGGCNSNAQCTNNNGGRTCTCNSGWTGNGVQCTGNIFQTDACINTRNKYQCYSFLASIHLKAC